MNLSGLYVALSHGRGHRSGGAAGLQPPGLSLVAAGEEIPGVPPLARCSEVVIVTQKREGTRTVLPASPPLNTNLH